MPQTTNYVQKFNGANLTDSVIYDNGNVGISTTSPGAKLDVNGSANITGSVGIGATTPVAPLTVLSGANGANNSSGGTVNVTAPTDGSGILRVESNTSQAIDTGASIGFYGRVTNGSANTSMLAGIRGYKATSSSANGDGYMSFVINRDGTGVAERMRIDANGKVGIGITSPTSLLHVNGGVQVGSPTGGDKGTGTINVAGDIYRNNTQYTNPDYVFQHHFDGDNQSGYQGMVALEQLEGHLREERQLPGIGREPMGVFGRQDILLEKLEEAYLYIVELTKRMSRLEATVTASGSSR